MNNWSMIVYSFTENKIVPNAAEHFVVGALSFPLQNIVVFF